MLQGEELSRICREQCQAKCCKYITVHIDPPTRRIDREEIRWFLCHRDVSVRFESRKWCLQVDTPCENLQADNTCAIYDTRPDICREYHHRECDHLGGKDDDTLVFTTPEQFEQFIAKRLERRRRKRKAARARPKKQSKSP